MLTSNDPSMRYVQGRHAIAALATLATTSALIINLAAANGRGAGGIAVNTALVVVFAALLCYAPTGNPKRDRVVLGAAIVDLIVLAPEANRGVPLMLAIVLAIRVSSRYGVRTGTLVVGLAVSGFAAAVRVAHPDRTPGLGPDAGIVPVTLVALVVFGLLIALTNAVRAEAAARAELLVAHDALRRSAEHLEEVAALRERSRIAMELHDAIGHGLTTTAVQIQSAARLRATNPTESDAFLRLAETSVGTLLRDVRQTVGTLRNEQPGTLAIDVALERLAAEFAQGIGLTVEREIAAIAVTPAVATMLYRVAQEALTNVARHAHATTVTLRLAADGDDAVTLAIADNGVGIGRDAERTGHGLEIIRERVISAGGTLVFESTPGGGTSIDVHAPRALPA